MPTQPLPQPPRKSESRFDEWLVLLWRRVSALGEASGAFNACATASVRRDHAVLPAPVLM